MPINVHMSDNNAFFEGNISKGLYNAYINCKSALIFKLVRDNADVSFILIWQELDYIHVQEP